MCWLGIGLHILGFTYSIFIIIWRGIFYHILKILPSLISLDIIESDLEIVQSMVLCVTSIFQLFYLFQMLKERRNYIDKLLYMFGFEMLYIKMVSLGDLPTSVGAIMLMVIYYGIPIIYFCRQPVYSFLNK